ncbi:hypothetical protein [Desulfonatronovibrio hydrogenovorans]|nr:hypothetical protein [Desulfonatronovibrio hydrogenovorans]
MLNGGRVYFRIEMASLNGQRKYLKAVQVALDNGYSEEINQDRPGSKD